MAEKDRVVGRKRCFVIDLTPVQKKIVESQHQNLIVSAGAGTGKTRVLVERFLYLVESGKALVQEVLALTFTDKAANEMKVRIMHRFQETRNDHARRSLESAYIMTFHSFAARLLKEHPVEAAVDPEFLVAEEEEADLLKEQAMDLVMEAAAAEPDVFDLLKIYGEDALRAGLEKIHSAAVTEGLRPQVYLSLQGQRPAEDVFSRQINGLLDELQDTETAEGWCRFHAHKDWSWSTAADFKLWYANFARKKKEKEKWTELKMLSEKYRAFKIGQFGEVYRLTFEKLLLNFDLQYQTLKNEKALLDFNDLELKLLELFEKEKVGNRKIRERYQRQFKYIMVDEFQDTNAVQSRILELLRSANHFFVVGDYKQSIYGFRGTSPAHFLRKLSESASQKDSLVVSLNENFRSDPRVLDFINLFFKGLWQESPQKFEPLRPKLESSSSAAPHVSVWTVPLEDKEKTAQARMREAGALAAEMKRLHEKEKVPYGDMVMLFRAMSVSAIYEQALKQQGIPFFAVSSRGFYHQSEIKDMMNFLAVLENPLLDIPLAAALRSPIFQVSDSTLLLLSLAAKKDDKNAPLYESLLQFEADGRIAASQKQKLREALQCVARFSQKKDRLRLDELIYQILEDTGYLVRMLADTQGVRRYANIQKLMDLAREAEQYERVKIRDFIGKIRKLENKEIRESEAQIEAEKSGHVVRLMSVHKAKGLEFPVVFVADMTHQNQSQDSKTFLAENDAGYSFKIWNPEITDWEKPLRWLEIDEQIKRREKDEMRRLLYVAMTRAKNKLILSGVVKARKEEKESLEEMANWGEWILFFQEELGSLAVYEALSRDSFTVPPQVPAEKKVFKELIQSLQPKPVRELIADTKIAAAVEQRVDQILAGLAPPARKPLRAIDLPVSAYAAYAKEASHYWDVYEKGTTSAEKSEEGVWEDRPAMMSAADFGTRMHEVFEHLDVHHPEETGARALKAVFKGGSDLEKKEAAALLQSFIKSNVFKELEKAKKIYREIPFILNERHGRIHGIIDLLFQDAAGKWVVLDYKTMYGTESAIHERGYREQILIYAWAVYQLTGAVPSRGILYFLKNQWDYSVDLDKEKIELFGNKLREMQDGILALYAGAADAKSAIVGGSK